MDVIYDIPIFKSLPMILNNDNNILPKTKLTEISIEDIYQLEPFKNNDNDTILITFLFRFFLIFLAFAFIFFLFIFTKKY